MNIDSRGSEEKMTENKKCVAREAIANAKSKLYIVAAAVEFM